MQTKSPFTQLRKVALASIWSAGFGVYAIRHRPILFRTQLDGSPGVKQWTT